MEDKAENPGIDRLVRGYFGIPAPPPGAVFPVNPKADPWQALAIAVQEAKTGNFTHLPRVLDLYDPSGDYRFNYHCIIFIGDAGTGSCFERIIAELEHQADPDDYEVGINYSRALTSRGLLADIPLLVKAYHRHAFFRDAAEIIPSFISSLLEPEPGPLSDPTEFARRPLYKAAVLARYQELSEAFGGDQVLVIKGERFGVVSMAERMIELLHKPYFSPNLRRKFEATTGIDCSAFYKKEVLQPLAAAAIVEEFLESPEAAKFEEGVRYFFGHRIPD